MLFCLQHFFFKTVRKMSYLTALKNVFNTPTNEQNFENLFQIISVNSKMIGKTFVTFHSIKII